MGMIFLGELTEDNIDGIIDAIQFQMDAMQSVAAVYDCLHGKREYDQTVKDWANYIIDNGADNPIFIQCLANGNLDMAQDVVDEAKIHYDVWIKEVSKKYDAG